MVGEASSVEASSGHEGVVLAGGDGLDSLRSIKAGQPQSVVVMLTSYESPTYLARRRRGKQVFEIPIR